MRTCFLDIEVLHDGTRFPTPEKAEQPVISITIYDNYDNYEDKYITLFYHSKYTKSSKIIDNHIILYHSSELEMLNTFARILKILDPDLIVGWNVDFDVNYLRNRMKQFNMKDVFADVQIFDLMTAYSRIFKPRSKSLSYVAVKEGFDGKTILAVDIPHLYQNDPEQIIFYNKHDVELLKLIEDKHKIIDFYITLKEYVGAPDINDCFYFSVLLDIVLLRLAKERNVVLPSKREATGEWYQGAIVFDPVGGLHKNVLVFDMSKYYPSILLTFEISPDGCGLVLDMVKFITEQRNRFDEELKKLEPGSDKYQEVYNMRQVTKELLNAVYGYIGYERSRIYDKDNAELVTQKAREGLLWAKKQFEERGFQVVYGDTDSIFVKLPDEYSLEECVKTGEQLAKEVTKSFDELIGKEHYFKMEFEKVFNPIILLPETKKRYAGRVVWEKGREANYIDVKGLEIRRTDSAEITKDIQLKVIEMILDGKRDEIINYLRDIVKKIRDDRVSPSDLAVNIGIQKSLASYGVNSGIPYHIRAAMYSNRYLGTRFDKGDKIKVLYVKGVKGYPKTDVIAFTDDMKLPEIIIDYDKMIEVVVRSKVEKLLEIANISWNEIEGRGLFRLR